jgi:putative transport protein
MDWLHDLIFGASSGPSVAHSIFLLASIIAIGIQLGKFKICGISLGSTFILFVGIICGQCGLSMDPTTVNFLRDFGLILFIYAIGMQVGPGFFSSFKKGGVTLNMLAVSIVLIGAIITLSLHYITGIDVNTMVGIMSGAVTNTPGLGAAQQALKDMGHAAGGDTMAMGYAVAYPLGVVGIILSMILIKYLFKINPDKENEDIANEAQDMEHTATPLSLEVLNPAIFGKTIMQITNLMSNRHFVVSRYYSHATTEFGIAEPTTALNEHDKIFVIVDSTDVETVTSFIGKTVPMERNQWVRSNSKFINRRILVTKPEINGKRLGELQLRKLYGINITRVNRAGFDLVASPGLILQIGDRVNVVGTESTIEIVENILGNSMRRLNQPNLVTIFIGIVLGVVLGSIPIAIPGLSQPFKLGLAGGPLIIAILISRFGYKWKLITYTTQSANFMLSELGISIFLACVGINAGHGFIDTIVNQGGFAWVGYGFLITFLPLMIVGIIARKVFKVNYFTIIGMISGSMTDPPALAYANSTTANDAPAVGYATVYPLTMFFRVLIAELLILIFV